MSIINQSIAKLMQVIPKEVLMSAFANYDDSRWRGHATLEEKIRKQVIDARVRVDCDLVGGEMVFIDLSSAETLFQGAYELVLRIPKKSTNGRVITMPLYVAMFSANSGYAGSAVFTNSSVGTGSGSYNAALSQASAVFNAYAPQQMLGSNSVKLLSENVIHLTDVGIRPAAMSLAAIISNDSELTNIKPSAAQYFFKLVELATKMIIWTNITVGLGDSAVRGGRESPRVRDIVDSYADAATIYEEYLRDTWTKVMFFNDKNRKHEHLRQITGGGW